jgi:deazaflavin-dependent oxidoreductase (nitroreductase family)
MNQNGIPAGFANRRVCYLSTTGRSSGRAHEIEIWFAVAPGDARRVYLLSGGGGRADWVKNLRREPRVSVRFGADTFSGSAHIIAADDEDDARARRLLQEKYQPGYGEDLSDWARRSLPVRIDIGGDSREAG